MKALREGSGAAWEGDAAVPFVYDDSRELSYRAGRRRLDDLKSLEKVLVPKGVGVELEARHLCMMMRGIQQQNNSAITSAMRGEFESDPKTRTEFMGLIRHRTDGLP